MGIKIFIAWNFFFVFNENTSQSERMKNTKFHLMVATCRIKVKVRAFCTFFAFLRLMNALNWHNVKCGCQIRECWTIFYWFTLGMYTCRGCPTINQAGDQILNTEYYFGIRIYFSPSSIPFEKAFGYNKNITYRFTYKHTCIYCCPSILFILHFIKICIMYMKFICKNRIENFPLFFHANFICYYYYV